MVTRQIRLDGPGVRGVRVSGTLLRDLLSIVIEGSQQALRIRTQGRSTARGALPAWIAAASEFSVCIREGSTVLELELPTLVETNPEEFRQRQLFPEVDPDLPAFDYLAESVEAALEGEQRANLYDRSMLKLLGRLDVAFSRGISDIVLEACDSGRQPRSVKLARQALSGLKALQSKIPRPRRVRIAGKLDSIRHSDQTFTLLLPELGETIKGIAELAHVGDLQTLWGRDVVVSGTVHFTASGGVQRIEAEALTSATPEDLHLWQAAPAPLAERIEVSGLRIAQGPRLGVNAIFGQWPGNESDEEVEQALENLS